MRSWRRSRSTPIWLALAVIPSWLALAAVGCGNVTDAPANVVDASRPTDASAPDTSPPGPPDAASPDATPDASSPGTPDAGLPDAPPADAASPDASPPDATPPDASPPDAAVPTFDGEWIGTTSQSKPLSFTALDNAITTLVFEWAVPACGVTGRTTTTFGGGGLPITASGTFAANVSGAPLSYLISGALGSSTGSGNITFNFSQPTPPFCTGSVSATWSVAR